MKQIKLKKTETGWAFGRIAIIRRKWELPFSCVSYTAIVDGLKVETDTLTEMREYLAEFATPEVKP